MTGFAERSDGLKAKGHNAIALKPIWLMKRSQVTCATGNHLHSDEIFRRGVEQGKADGGKRHESDRLQALAGIGNGGGG
jgi:hypothetical protein